MDAHECTRAKGGCGFQSDDFDEFSAHMRHFHLELPARRLVVGQYRTAVEAAAALGVSQATVYRRAKRGELELVGMTR